MANKNVRNPGLVVSPISRVQMNLNSPISKNIVLNNNIKNIPFIQRTPQSNLALRRF